jgi:hypothetical protein
METRIFVRESDGEKFIVNWNGDELVISNAGIPVSPEEKAELLKGFNDELDFWNNCQKQGMSEGKTGRLLTYKQFLRESRNINEGLFGTDYFKEVELIVPTTGEYAQVRELAKKKGGKLKVAFFTGYTGGVTVDDIVSKGEKAIKQALEKGYYSLFPMAYIKNGNDIPDKIEFKDLSGKHENNQRAATIYVVADMWMPMSKFFKENEDKFNLSGDIERMAAAKQIAKLVVNDVVLKVCKTNNGTTEFHSILEADGETVKKFAKQNEKAFKVLLNTNELLKEGTPFCKYNLTFSAGLAHDAAASFKENAERYMKKHQELLENYPNFKQFCTMIAKQAVVE